MKLISRAILICGLIASTAAFAPGQGQDIEGSKDHPLISRYPGSWIIGYIYKEYDEYLFPEGKVQDDKPAKSEDLEGKITRITYKIPDGRSTLEVYRNFESAPQASALRFALARFAACSFRKQAFALGNWPQTVFRFRSLKALPESYPARAVS